MLRRTTSTRVPVQRRGLVARLVTTLALASSLLAVPMSQTSAQAAPTVRHTGKVVKIVDGDTIDVRLSSGKVKRIRILGVDTPEVHGRTECYGKKASAATKRLIPVGTKVRLTSDSTQDRTDQYGRWLRHVHRSKDNTDVSRWLLKKGYARTFIWWDNPLKKAKTYRAAEASAKKARRGLWRAC
ncbi:thermonuclease family protein [Nocardioides yefusunii]|uniref:Thermonuclease family protein n=1 Tax=Nocardioides yefusunii TaxID=2500546 RepID=A0ABW1QWQ9_9ACTN|nr:thermonuclease family protein [Nocardioides yefusunii]